MGVDYWGRGWGQRVCWPPFKIIVGSGGPLLTPMMHSILNHLAMTSPYSVKKPYYESR